MVFSLRVSALTQTHLVHKVFDANYIGLMSSSQALLGLEPIPTRMAGMITP
ncbi:MAG: hypothetical protein F6K30_00260 [Cyanothece sp. SIO2G6]|nr:hypothetical protein [Cyanothece sp. SIO2G6]